MICASRGVGLYVASETHRVVWSRATKPGARLLIYVQGSHGTAETTFNAERPDLEALARAGFIVALADVSQTTSQGTFGNTTSQTRIGQLRTFMLGASSPIVPSSGEMFLVGGSGGAAAILNYARANPANVAAIAATTPLVDLQDFYTSRTDATITQAEVNAAYGGDVTASYATHNPSASGNQTALAGVPMKLYYSTDDPYIPVSTVTNYETLVRAVSGTIERQSLGAVGHTDAGVSYEEVGRWLNAHS